MPEIEIYWGAAAIWLVGFLVWLGATYLRPSITALRLGSVLCWIGFAGTIWPHLAAYNNPPFEWPTSFDPRSLTPDVIYTLIRVGWALGFGLWAISWFRPAWHNVGWAGFVISMTAVAISWTKEPHGQVAALILGIFLVFLVFFGTRAKQHLATARIDYAAKLVVLCHGNRAQAERLIAYESKRHGLSRQAAARAAVESLVRDRGGH